MKKRESRNETTPSKCEFTELIPVLSSLLKILFWVRRVFSGEPQKKQKQKKLSFLYLGANFVCDSKIQKFFDVCLFFSSSSFLRYEKRSFVCALCISANRISNT